MTEHCITPDRRRQHAADLLERTANQTSAERVATLRRLAAECLNLDPVNAPPFGISPAGAGLPSVGHLLAEYPHRPGPAITAAYFDLSAVPHNSPRGVFAGTGVLISGAQIQYPPVLTIPAVRAIAYGFSRWPPCRYDGFQTPKGNGIRC